MLQIRRILISFALALIATGASAQEAGSIPPPPPKKAVATVSISETQYALILGGSSGTGILTYKNKDYPFKLSGLSLGANIGVSKMSAKGEVFDMPDISKFTGTYSNMESGITLGVGGAGSVLKNEHGVMMNLTSSTEGVQLNLSAGGVKVEWAK